MAILPVRTDVCFAMDRHKNVETIASLEASSLKDLAELLGVVLVARPLQRPGADVPAV